MSSAIRFAVVVRVLCGTAGAAKADTVIKQCSEQWGAA